MCEVKHADCSHYKETLKNEAKHGRGRFSNCGGTYSVLYKNGLQDTAAEKLDAEEGVSKETGGINETVVEGTGVAAKGGPGKMMEDESASK